MKYPHPKSQRLYNKKEQKSVPKIFMYYKLGQACVTNWGSFGLLQIRANVITKWGSFIITNWDNCYYKLKLKKRFLSNFSVDLFLRIVRIVGLSVFCQD